MSGGLVGMLAGFSPPVAASRIPAPADATIAALRPNGRAIAELVVAPRGGNYVSIKDAAAAASTIQAARMTAEGATTITPNYRVDIIVRPGIYGEEVAAPPFTAYYADGPRGSVQLHQLVTAAVPLVGVLAPIAGNIYWEGIDIVELYQDVYIGSAPKYPIHGFGKGTCIYARCTLDSQKTAGATPVGSDGYDGGTTLFYDCDLMPGNTNNHGAVANRIPAATMYINCRSAGVVNYDALNNVVVDHLWVVGGSVYGVSLIGTASRLHLDPTTVVGAGGIVKPTGSQDANVDWPIPVGGLSAADRAYYGM